jgi:hypothetical protein
MNETMMITTYWRTARCRPHLQDQYGTATTRVGSHAS